MSIQVSPPAAAVDPRAVTGKVWWRIVPLVFILYLVAYLDRANVGYVKDHLKERFALADDKEFELVYGWGTGIFFIGYLLLEAPGTLLVEHWSARKWFARILVSWGFCSMATALVRTPTQFFVVRFLLGVAEAGFYPGIIVYFTHWFPRAERGRAMSGLVLGIPVGLALGAPVSAQLLSVNWLGLGGWQWLFVLEGLPAVALGVAVPFLMPDRPHHARWLGTAEREWLEATLRAEKDSAAVRVTLRQALRLPAVWLLALGIFATNTGGYALVFYLPSVVKELLTNAGYEIVGNSHLNWLALTYLFGLAGVVLSGRLSDASRRWKWYCIAGQVLTGVFLTAMAAGGQPWGAVVVWLCVVQFFAFFWPSPFWVLPTLTLSTTAAAVAIAAINMSASVAGQVGPAIFGVMQARGYDYRACLLVAAGWFTLGGVIVAFLRIPRVPPTGEGTVEERV